MSLGSPWEFAVAEQRRSNEKAWEHRATFAQHRARLTALCLDGAAGGRLCVLGAGNCADVDLGELTSAFDEVHLVDLDEGALKRAHASVEQEQGRRVFLHGGVDLSGLGDRLPRWRALQTSPEELMRYPEDTALTLRERLLGGFDVVLSACLLSQMHLCLRQALGATHPLFSAGTYCLNLAHLRTLVALLAEPGRALLACDVSSDEIAPFPPHALLSEGAGLAQLHEREERGQLFHAVAPQQLRDIANDDPTLRKEAHLSAPEAAWLWQNGPRRRFLVCALTLRRTRTPAEPSLT